MDASDLGAVWRSVTESLASRSGRAMCKACVLERVEGGDAVVTVAAGHSVRLLEPYRASIVSGLQRVLPTVSGVRFEQGVQAAGAAGSDEPRAEDPEIVRKAVELFNGEVHQRKAKPKRGTEG